MATTEFDYVIVGAGSGGCVLANRLTEDGNVTVALLEAGGRDINPWIHIPAGYYRNISNPNVTWQYGSGPEPHLGGRMVNWPRGRVLGGSSAINGLLYVRGQHQDYDVWRQLGNVGWSFRDVLPYFMKAEDQGRGENELHGVGGPLGVEDVRMDNPLCEAFVKSCVAEGIPRTDDFNGPSQEGAGYYQLTNRNGRRCSTAVGYLHPIRKRPNLFVITDAEAQSLAIANRRVTGVRVLVRGQPRLLTARREVVLAAGAIGSPMLLERSGVGAPEVLRRAGVEVVHALPGVGENLQDHYQARMMYECRAAGSLNEVWHSRWMQIAAGIEYALRRSGPLTIGAGVAGAFAKSHPSLENPDIQFHFIPLSADGPGQGLHPFPGVIVSVCQLRPDSRGSIHVTSAAADATPSIVSNYLAAESDRHVLLEAMELARRIVKRPPFADVVVREIAPGVEVVSEAELMAFAKAKGTTIFHPVGTCKMGSDPMAVVDARLRVHGLAGIRIADGAIMPTLISGNTNAPIVMIAEKAADMMKADQATAAAAA